MTADEYKNGCEKFAESTLRPYIQLLERDSFAITSKEINDAVWKTIVVAPFEVLILDSPLLQRLRRIKQLGVAHWVYPGASHSRLEHSVGALHQVQRLLENMRTIGPRTITVEKPWVNLLRLAALCHDVGHGLMSHVAENALRSIATVEELLDQLGGNFKQKSSLSEAAAYFMLGSPAFADLLNVAGKRTGGAHEFPAEEDTSKLLQKTILGLVVNNRFPLLQQLISGPFDADKLDYMTRDAYMAGVPVVTDMSRLVQKVRITELDRDSVPPEIAEVVDASENTFCLQGIAMSGARTLDELLLGRTLLFDKVYRHQKVRATESMVAKIVHDIAALIPEHVGLLPLMLDDEDLLPLRRSVLAEKLGVNIDDGAWNGLEAARRLSQNLVDRRLFVRAYAFAQNMPMDPLSVDPDQIRAIGELQRIGSAPELVSPLIDEIVEQIARMIECNVSIALPTEQLAANVAIGPPTPPGHASKGARAYLISEDRKPVKYSEDFAESKAWSDAYPMTRDLGYVFSAKEIAIPVYLACEIVFRRRFGLRTPESAVYYSKVTKKEVEEMRATLTARGYYNGLPDDFRAEPDRLKKLDVVGKIKTVVATLGPYEGLYNKSGGAQDWVTVDEVRIRSWLRQFRSDVEIDCALKILENLKVLRRKDVTAALQSFVAKHSAYQNAYVCPFGGPNDSSAFLTYFAGDDRSFEARSLSDALQGDPERGIIFIDDIVGSGNQSATIVKNWFGKADQTSLDEDHGSPLSQPLQELLAKRKLAFVFVYGLEDGIKTLVATLQELKLTEVTYVHTLADNLPTLESALCEIEKTGREQFILRCREIGGALLKDYDGQQRSDEWIGARALGYGNHGYLLVFPYNIPSQTLTMLWCSGNVAEWEWLPLLPRRKKV